MLAAHKTGRRARLIEIDPHYCDLIVRRFEKHTGKQVRLAETGETFEELSERRRRAELVLSPLTSTDTAVESRGCAVSKPMKNGRDYLVGFGKPPEHSRYRKGQSGNPKGRPKGKKNRHTIIDDVLFEPIRIQQNGKAKTVPALEAIVLKLRNDALGGNRPQLRQFNWQVGPAAMRTAKPIAQPLLSMTRRS